MDLEEIKVTKTEQFATLAQYIEPETQDQVIEILAALVRQFRKDSWSGSVTIGFRDGGVRNVVCGQQSRYIADGSAADRALEPLYRGRVK
jgi:hypothetical protein